MTTLERARRGPYAKGVQRRQQIVDRALEVFNEVGLEGTSLRAIGQALGVTHAALAHYFGSREELLLEVLRQADARALREASASITAVGDFGSRIAEYQMRIPGLMALYNSMLARSLERGNEHSRRFFEERFEVIRRQTLLILERGRATGEVRADIPLEVTAGLVIAASDGLSAQWLLNHGTDMIAGMHLLDQLLRPAADTDSSR